MADKPSKRPSTDRRATRPGVRGPGGPPSQVPGSASGRARPQPRPLAPTAPGERSDARRRFEARSAPLLLALTRLPRWLVVVVMALVLFAGLIMPASLGWLGCILLLFVAAFLGWLLALSWPAIAPSARWLRVFVVAALVGIAVLKALGRF